VTDHEKYPNAPAYLPLFMMIGEEKILELKNYETIVKFDNASDQLTTLILCVPWRNPEDLDGIESSNKIKEDAFSRRKEILPYSSFEVLDC
jgi:hypothetical protein